MRLIIFILFFILIANLLVSHEIRATEKPFVNERQWKENIKGYDYNEDFKTIVPKKTNKSIKPSKSLLNNLHSYKNAIIVAIIIVLGILIILLVLWLFKDFRWKVPNKKSELQFQKIENIEDADLELYLQQAISAGQYKEIIRYNYLIAIRTLNQKKLINWKKDKTNGYYVKEMHGKRGYELFRTLTTKFERIWYGETEMKEIEVQEILPLFTKLNKIVLNIE